MGGGEVPNPGEIELKCTVEYQAAPFNEEREVLAMASIKAPALLIEEATKRPTVDVICVIDRSVSMAGEKIRLMKDALNFVVDQLDSGDSIGLITYDTSVSTDFELQKMIPANKKAAKEAIKQITPGAMTNLSGGLLLGLTMAASRETPATICSILLFTDGLANVGITNVNQLTTATENKLKKCIEGTTVFTFGFGADHDAQTLRSIATAGKGMYYFIESVDQIPLSFADCIGGLQSTVAQNLKLTIESLDASKVIKVLSTGFKANVKIPGKQIEVVLGDLYGEEERDILVSFLLPKTPVATESFPFCHFKLEYFNVLSMNDQDALAGGSIARNQAAPKFEERNKELDKQHNRLIIVDAMETGRKLADQGKLTEARVVLEEAKARSSSSPSRTDHLTNCLNKEVDEVLHDMETESTYASKGKFKLYAKAQSHGVQRSNNANLEQGVYETSSKFGKKKAFFH